jgi:hypothetical protein
MSSLLSQVSLGALKVESTLGTFNAPLVADAAARWYRSGGGSMLRVSRDYEEREALGGFGTDSNVPNTGRSAFSAFMHLHGKGSAGLPVHSFIWQALGFGVSSQTYTTTTDVSAWRGVSAAEYRNGRFVSARGLMGTGSIDMTAGKPFRLNVDLQGGERAATDTPYADAAILSPTYEAVSPPLWQGSTSSQLGGSDLRVATARIDIGNNVTYIEDANAAGGILCGYIGGRVPTLTLDPIARLRATIDFYAAFRAQTEYTYVAVANGGSNNTITITCTKCVLTNNPEEGDREGKLVDNLNFRVNGTIAVAYS